MLWLNNKGAAARASSRAHHDAVDALEDGLEVAPCTNCGALPGKMAKVVRRGAWGDAIRVFVWFTVGPIVLIAGLIGFQLSSTTPSLLVWGVAVVLLALWAWLQVTWVVPGFRQAASLSQNVRNRARA